MNLNNIKKKRLKTKDREFIINSSGLVKYVNNHKDVEETVELTNVLEYLGLKGHSGIIKAIKNKELYKGYYWSR